MLTPHPHAYQAPTPTRLSTQTQTQTHRRTYTLALCHTRIHRCVHNEQHVQQEPTPTHATHMHTKVTARTPVGSKSLQAPVPSHAPHCQLLGPRQITHPPGRPPTRHCAWIGTHLPTTAPAVEEADRVLPLCSGMSYCTGKQVTCSWSWAPRPHSS